MTNTIIFDFDGTIADTFQSSIEIINSLAEKYSFKTIENTEIENLRSKSMRDILKDRHIQLFRLPSIINDFTKLAEKTISSRLPIDSVPQILKELYEHDFDLNIITSNSVSNVTLFLNKHNLPIFNHIYSDKSLFGKNIIISRFLKKYQIKNKDAIFVGDEIRDIEAAHKANIKIISVSWGFNSEEALNRYSPDYLVSKPRHLLDVINKLK